MNAQMTTFRGKFNMGAIHKGWDLAASSNSQILSLDLFNEVSQKKFPFQMCLGREKHGTPVELKGH